MTLDSFVQIHSNDRKNIQTDILICRDAPYYVRGVWKWLSYDCLSLTNVDQFWKIAAVAGKEHSPLVMSGQDGGSKRPRIMSKDKTAGKIKVVAYQNIATFKEFNFSPWVHSYNLPGRGQCGWNRTLYTVGRIQWLWQL